MYELDKFAIVGRGNQARSWQENLVDAGLKTPLLVRSNPKENEFLLEESLKNFNIFALLIPDHEHINFLKKYSSFIPKNSLIIYAHGFSMSRQKINEAFPLFKHMLWAPKSIAVEIRKQFLLGKKTPAVYSLEFLENKKEALDFINLLGPKIGFKNLIEVSFEEETNADLFSEQTLLCNLFPLMMKSCFDIMVKNGISPTLSYLESWHESKLILNTIIDKGPEFFFDLISPNALIGSQSGKEQLNFDFENEFQKVFNSIKNKEFDKYLEKSDFQNTKIKTNNFWKKSEVNKTFKKIKEEIDS